MALKRITEVTIISSSEITETPHAFIEHDGAFYRVNMSDYQHIILGNAIEDLEEMIAEEFSTSSTYEVGDLVRYNGSLYECTTAITTAGAWNASKWTELDLATKVSTDKTLTLSNRPADAKKVGDEINSLKEDLNVVSEASIGNKWLPFIHGKYWKMPNDDVTPCTLESTASGFSCASCPCTEGDVFTVKAYGSSGTQRAYAWVKSDYTIIAKIASNTTVDDEITAPANAAYLLVNTKNEDNSSPSTGYFAMKGKTLAKMALKYVKILTSTDDIDNVTDTGWYYWKSTSIPTNAPTLLACKMLVLAPTSSNVHQIVFSTSTTVPSMYERSKTSDGYGAWTMFVRQQYILDNYEQTPMMYRRVSIDNLTANPLTEDWETKRYTSLDDGRNLVLTIESKYTGTTAPTLRIYCYGPDRSTQFYYSHVYEVGSANEYIRQSFRIPNGSQIGAYRITITVPEGTSLAVRAFGTQYETGIRKGTGEIVFHAHRGFDAIYAGGSYNGVVAAAELGFQSCIVIPKFTSDGVPVCFHDDAKISGQMTQMDGTEIPDEYDLPVSQLTYDQLMQWSIGYSKRPAFGDAKILKMDDFLRICAETGMRPIFSVHPTLTTEQWTTLKGLLDKYKLTKYLSVKSANYDDVWTRVINVFGNGNIYSIILLYSTSSTYNIINYIAAGITASGLDPTKTRLDCEFFDSSLISESIGSTQMAQLEAAIAAGYTTSVVLRAQTSGKAIKDYIGMGVTEFTNGHHCSMGLNW